VIRQSIRSESGFSLIEVVIAAGLLVTALVSLAQLFAIAARSNSSARVATVSAILAAAKVEELRSVAFAMDESGTDYVEGSYFRRWRVRQLVSNPNIFVIEVAAGPIAANSLGDERRPGEAWLATAKTRTAR